MIIATKEGETLYTASSVVPSGVVTVSVSIMALKLTKKRVHNRVLQSRHPDQKFPPIPLSRLLLWANPDPGHESLKVLSFKGKISFSLACPNSRALRPKHRKFEMNYGRVRMRKICTFLRLPSKILKN